MKKDKHVGSKEKRRAFPALVAVLILALLTVATWTTARVAGDGTAAPDLPGTGQTGGKNTTPDNEDLPVARPHPRGRARPHGHPQENREPGPLVTESVGRQALPGIGLNSMISAGLRRLVHPRSSKSAVEEPAGSERARGPGQDTAATRRFPMDAGLSGGFTLLLGGAEDRGRRR
jgi:hypothetical protein